MTRALLVVALLAACSKDKDPCPAVGVAICDLREGLANGTIADPAQARATLREHAAANQSCVGDRGPPAGELDVWTLEQLGNYAAVLCADYQERKP